MVQVRDLFLTVEARQPVDLRVLARKPLMVPEPTPALNLLEMFQRSGDAVVRREDGSWLVDGSLAIGELLEALELRRVPGGEDGFRTVGGLVLAHLRRIPKPGDRFEADGWSFEVVDMDRHRIGKVLIRRM